MKRIYPPYSYGSGPREKCWWDETIAAPDWPELHEDIKVDVAIVGGGFTGMSSALHLAEDGTSVAVLEAATPGWGASGRNGGFCCLGGARIGETALARKYGVKAADEYGAAEHAAVDLVAELLDRLTIDADRHSDGETQLAHNKRSLDRMQREAEKAPDAVFNHASELPGLGMNGPFLGALTTPVGFGLNPRKYLFGLAKSASSSGAHLYQQSPVISHERQGTGYRLNTPHGQVRCEKIIFATNGYSSEDMPDWFAGRYMPTQSSVLVTRPLTDAELAAQGWTSDQMAYDTRNLLHYFRLMPDRRFLFGARGGLLSSTRSDQRAFARVRRDFEAMFPAWRDVESPNQWSGFVCLSRNQVPFAGSIPDQLGMFAGLAYHGNGVAMGSYTGRLLANLALGRNDGPIHPEIMRKPMQKFPLGRARRLLMPPVYAAMGLRDL